jgi:two-component system chemotaxis response regulator CheY
MSLLAQLKILVVDDTTTSRMLLRDALETIGFRNISVAADGEQAMQVMMSQPCHLIISDMNMPKMNGLQLLHAIRTYRPTSRVPFRHAGSPRRTGGLRTVWAQGKTSGGGLACNRLHRHSPDGRTLKPSGPDALGKSVIVARTRPDMPCQPFP